MSLPLRIRAENPPLSDERPVVESVGRNVVRGAGSGALRVTVSLRSVTVDLGRSTASPLSIRYVVPSARGAELTRLRSMVVALLRDSRVTEPLGAGVNSRLVVRSDRSGTVDLRVRSGALAPVGDPVEPASAGNADEERLLRG